MERVIEVFLSLQNNLSAAAPYQTAVVRLAYPILVTRIHPGSP